MSADVVRMPVGWLWMLRVLGPVVGVLLALAVDPLLGWLVRVLDSAPGPLRIAGEVPTPWLVAVLAVLGLVGGLWLADHARRDGLEVRVEPSGLWISRGDDVQYVPRAPVSAVFTDLDDLVVRDTEGRELFRGRAQDLSARTLGETLTRHGYPWHGTLDPHEDEFRDWVDGHPDLTEEAHARLRARRDARRADRRGDRSDDVGHEDAALQDLGVVVRDRGGRQQYRVLPGTDPTAG